MVCPHFYSENLLQNPPLFFQSPFFPVAIRLVAARRFQASESLHCQNNPTGFILMKRISSLGLRVQNIRSERILCSLISLSESEAVDFKSGLFCSISPCRNYASCWWGNDSGRPDRLNFSLSLSLFGPVFKMLVFWNCTIIRNASDFAMIFFLISLF